MVNIDAYKGWIFGLRAYTGFLLTATILGYFWSNHEPVTLYRLGISFIFLLFFCFAPSRIVISKYGKLTSILFCAGIVCSVIYEIYHPREFMTLKMHVDSQMPIIIAALLWCILIRFGCKKV